MQTTCVTPSSARRRESRDWISTRRTHVADVRRAEDGVDVVAGRARRVPGPQRPEVARARRAHRGAGRAEVGQRPQHADARLGDGRAPHEERVPDAVRARREGQREEGRVAQAVVDHEVLRDEVVVREQRVQAPEHEVPVRRREEVRVHVDAGRRVHDLARDGGDVLAADLERVVGEVHGRRGGLGRGARAGRRGRRRERREQLRLRHLVRRPAHRERRRVRRDQHLHRDLDGRAARLAAGQRRDRRDRPRDRRVHVPLRGLAEPARGRRVAAQILGEGAGHRRHGSHRS